MIDIKIQQRVVKLLYGDEDFSFFKYTFFLSIIHLILLIFLVFFGFFPFSHIIPFVCVHVYGYDVNHEK